MRGLMDSRRHVVSPLKVISGTVALTSLTHRLRSLLTFKRSQHTLSQYVRDSVIARQQCPRVEER